MTLTKLTTQTSSKKQLAKSVLIYFVGSVLSRVALFFLLPIYTRFVPAADMGLYDAGVAFVTFISAIIFIEIWQGALRFIIDKKKIEDKRVAVYTTFAITLCAMAFYAAASVAVGFIFNIDYFVWIALFGFFMCILNVYNNTARGYGLNGSFALAGLINTAVSVIAKIVFLTVFEWNYSALFIAACIGMIAAIFFLEIRCKVIIKFRCRYFDKKLFKEILRFSWPLALNGAAYWALASVNRLLVTFILGAEYNGILAIATQFTMIIMLISSSFQLVWQEIAFARKNNQDKQTGVFYSKVFDLNLKIVMAGILLVIPAIYLGLELFPWFIDVQYVNAITLIPVAMVAATFSVWSLFLGAIFGAIKKTKHVLICTLTGAAINIAVLFSLIYFIGVIAAPIALMCGFAANVLVRTLLLRKLVGLRVHYWYFLIFVPLLMGAILTFMYLSWEFNLIYLLSIFVVTILILKKKLVLGMQMQGVQTNMIKLTENQAKKLKLYQIDMLDTFVKICAENNLKYMFLGGTCLGAVRHKGFIPWDDDIDVGLPRCDYEKFALIAKNALPSNMYYQSLEGDTQYPKAYAKIRLNDTRFLEECVKNMNMHHGIYLDIFPLDGCGDTFEAATKHYEKAKSYIRVIEGGQIARFAKQKSISASIKRFYSKFFTPKQTYNKMIIFLNRYPVSNSAYVGNLFGGWGIKEVVKKEVMFGENMQTSKVEFEGKIYNAPYDTHAYLAAVYGDYMTLPPLEKRVSHHGIVEIKFPDEIDETEESFLE